MSAHEETKPTTETPVTPASDAAAAPDSGAPGATPDAAQAATDRDDKGRFRNPVQPRIDELTRKQREAERETAYWRGRAEAREAKEAEAAAKAPDKPKASDFESYDEYVEALTDWKSDAKIKANNEALGKRTAKERAATESRERWNERSTAARAVHSDYDEVLSAAADVKLVDHVCEALDESDKSAELLYQIAKDPSIADRLNAMSPRQAALELGRMEAKLQPVSAENPDPEVVPADAKPAPQPVRKTTSAPPPIKPIAKGGSTQTDLSKVGMDEYVSRRREHGASWARR